MPIEFRCTKCNKLLRTQDDTAGKQAKCPECEEILQIPMLPSGTSSLAEGPTLPLNPSPFASTELSSNPYQSPIRQYPDALPENLDISHDQITMGGVFGNAWLVYKNHVVSCIGICLLVMIINFVFQVVFQMAVIVAANNGFPFVISLLIGAIALVLFQVWLVTGQMLFFLKLTRGQSSGIFDLFSGGRWFLWIGIAGVVVAIIYMFGLFVFLVPGIIAGFALPQFVAEIVNLVSLLSFVIPCIIVGLMLSQFPFLIIDHNLGPIGALYASRKVTSGNKRVLFGIFLVSIMLPFMLMFMAISSERLDVVIATISIFGLVYLPWFWILLTTCYLSMTNQKTAYQFPSQQEIVI